MVYVQGALSPHAGPIPRFSVLHTEKQEGLADGV